MALFKSKEVEAPPADPPAEEAPPAEPQYVTVEQFEAVSKTLDTVNESLKAMTANQQAYRPPEAPAAPAVDPHQEQKDRILKIDKQLADLTKQAEEAAYAGKGLGEVMAQQNRLNAERSEIQGQIIAGRSDPRLDAGFQTLDALSTEITSGKMAHLKIPEVKARYDYYIAQMPAEQRMNPEAKMGVYNLAVGENLTIIQESQKQEWLREADNTPTQEGGSGDGRTQEGKEGGIPAPDTILSREAMRSIRTSRHHNPDQYYQSLGYKGWEDYYEKNKEYLVEGEEE